MTLPRPRTKPTTISMAQLRQWIPARPIDSQKGKNGHLLILAGSRDMSGAAVLSALGALRAGAGLVTVACVRSIQSVVSTQLPEVLTLGLPESDDGYITEKAIELLDHCRAARPLAATAIGPGLGKNSAVAKVVRSLIKNWNLPMVVDADGLNNAKPEDLRNTGRRIITPHPGELARLLEVTTDFIQKDRHGIAHQTALDLGVICLLKGHHTVITDGRSTRINPTGNPAMSTGGMGDVLTGVIGALAAQRVALFDAACAGAYLHGLAADLSRITDRGLLAHEVADALPLALRKLRTK